VGIGVSEGRGGRGGEFTSVPRDSKVLGHLFYIGMKGIVNICSKLRPLASRTTWDVSALQQQNVTCAAALEPSAALKKLCAQ